MNSVDQIITALADHYEQSVANLQTAIRAFVEHGTLPDAEQRRNGGFSYPLLRIEYDGRERGSSTDEPADPES